MRSTDSILWTVKFRNGMVKRFKFPIRTTPEGQAVPDGGFETKADLNSHAALHRAGFGGHGGRVPSELKEKTNGQF